MGGWSLSNLGHHTRTGERDLPSVCALALYFSHQGAFPFHSASQFTICISLDSHGSLMGQVKQLTATSPHFTQMNTEVQRGYASEW